MPPPRPAVVEFAEYKDYRSLHDVNNRVVRLAAQHAVPVSSGCTVYVFRRQGGRATVAATLAPGATFRIPGTAADAGAVYYACVSHVPLLPLRLAQYCDPGNFLALERRCFVFNPADGYRVLTSGPGRHVMVLPNWRRLAMEMHDGEQQALEHLHAFAEDQPRAQERLLAELTLGTAVQYERHDRDVWQWLRRGDRPAGWAGPRAPGMDGKPYTAAEAVLARYAQEAKRIAENLEQWADAKYWLMQQEGFRQMRYDTLVDPERNRATIVDQGRLLAPALQSSFGQAFVREYASGEGHWYARLLINPQPHEIEAFRADPQVAEAYWAILAVVGSALMSGARPSAESGGDHAALRPGDPGRATDRTSQAVELGKNSAGGVDSRVRAGNDNAQSRARTAEAARDAAAAESRAAANSAARANAAAGEARRAANTPVVVLERYLRVSITTFTGSPPPMARYDAQQARFVAITVSAGTAARTSTVGAERPEVGAAARAAQGRADAAGRSAAAAGVRAAAAEITFLDASAFARMHAGRAWASTAAVAAMGAINLCLALSAWQKEDSLDARVKAAGAFADLLYAGEYPLLRLAQGRAGGIGSRLVLGVRVAGIIGGSVSAYYAFQDAGKAYRRGDTDLLVGASALGVGSTMLVLGALGGFAAGTALAGYTVIAMLSATWWTGIGIVLTVVGAGLLFLFANPPVEDWIKGCPWGVDPEGRTTAQHLSSLLQLLCTPAISAHKAESGVRVTLRPPLFIPGETVISGELVVRRVEIRTGVGSARGSGLPSRSRVAREAFTIDLDPRAQAALASGRTAHLSNRSGLRADVRAEQGRYVFDFHLRTGSDLRGSAGGIFSSFVTFECTGTAHVRLWEHHADSAWRSVRLEPSDLPTVTVEGTR